MSEYIDKSYLLNIFSSLNDKKNGNEHFLYGIETAVEIVENAPTADVAQVVHSYRISAKKHKWKRDSDGNIDFMAWHSGYCNGPLCLECGEHFCIHCVRGEEVIKSKLESEDCYERSVCSLCGRDVPDDAPYCNCGAKMD